MLYENLYSYYSPYEEQELLRQMDHFDQPPRLSSLNYSRRQKKSYTSSGSSVIDSSPSSSAASSSPSQSSSKKVTPSNLDTLSFCHTIYITINKGGTTPSSSSSVDYAHLSPEDCQLLLLPDICCTIPTSKWSSLTRERERSRWLNIIVDDDDIVFRLNLPSASISFYKHVRESIASPWFQMSGSARALKRGKCCQSLDRCVHGYAYESIFNVVCVCAQMKLRWQI